MSEQSQNLDKAGVSHWNETERNVDIPLEIFAPTRGLRGHARRRWHAELHRHLDELRRPGAELLELGCGGSAYLPYFAKAFGFTVSGIDYSPGGVDMAERICNAHGVFPTLHCADFFAAPAECTERYDAVVSFGVVEHFTDTNATVNAFSRFVRPGGKLLTVVPNMQGLSGLGQRLLAPEIHRIHEVITTQRLEAAYRAAGLTFDRCSYFLFNNFGVISVGTHANWPARTAHQVLRAATGAIWALESLVGDLPPNALTSPYLLCVGRKDA